MEYLQLYITIVFLAILLMVTPWIKDKKYVLFPSLIILIAISCTLSIKTLLGFPFVLELSGSLITGKIKIILDSLSAWFILIISFTFLTGALFGNQYLRAYKPKNNSLALHWSFYILCYSALIAVCVIQNILVFLIAWEIMALSAFFLILFEGYKSKVLKAAINYLIQSHIAIVFITIGFLWVYSSTKTFDFEAIALFSSQSKPFISFLLMVLLFIGFGTKAGFFPFHTWLPVAHPEAPSHVSGVMSGVLVKIGIYGILRSLTFLHQDFTILGVFILLISLISGLYGIINASVHRDFKRMLAYCTIENIGIIGFGIGIGLIGMGYNNQWLILLGFSGALLHTLNHSLVKSLLFYAAGSVYQQTHTRDMEKLGGLNKYMPKTAIIFLIGAIGIAGILPLNGFISEFVLYSGIIGGLEIHSTFNIMFLISIMAALAIIGGFSIFVFTKNFGTIFLGSPRTGLSCKAKEVSLQMRIPQYMIIVIMMSIVAFPSFYFNYAIQASMIYTNYHLINSLQIESFSSVLQSIGYFSILFIAIIAIIYFIRQKFSRKIDNTVSATWGCGYIWPKPTMQYTGKSFSKSVTKLFSFMLPESKKYKNIENSEVFPNKRNHSTYFSDFIEYYIIDKFLILIYSFMNVFKFVQNGKLQRYILVGLFFILTILSWLLIDLLNGIFK